MFSSFTTHLRAEVETIKRVIETHDRVRALVFLPASTHSPGTAEVVEMSSAYGIPTTSLTPAAGEIPATAIGLPVPQLDEIRREAPSRGSWQVYDHCAAFTRLYAIYEEFIRDLVSEYLRLIPTLYERYEDLPGIIVTQHRLGIAQILLKLGKDPPCQYS